MNKELIVKLAENCGSVSNNKNDERTTYEFDLKALTQYSESYYAKMLKLKE